MPALMFSCTGSGRPTARWPGTSGPTPARSPRSKGRSRSSDRPRRLTLPPARAKPHTASMRVVLPAPFGPMRPTISPRWTSKETSSTAVTPPYRTTMCRSDRTVSSVSAATGRLGLSATTGAAVVGVPETTSLPARQGSSAACRGRRCAFRVLHHGEDEQDARHDRVPVAQMQLPVRELVDDATERQHPGDDAARHRRDAGQIGDGEDAQPQDGVEVDRR